MAFRLVLVIDPAMLERLSLKTALLAAATGAIV